MSNPCPICRKHGTLIFTCPGCGAQSCLGGAGAPPGVRVHTCEARKVVLCDTCVHDLRLGRKVREAAAST